MKRIILCADGTWNEPTQVDSKTGRRKPTNVLKIARAVLPRAHDGTTQVVYYHEGLGTDRGLDKWTGGAFGRGMEENVRALYRFVVLNYEPGDELYFFGFSRGAFTVRTLAGFMHAIGLLAKKDEFYTPDLYGLYETSATTDSPAWKKAFERVQDRRPCPPILFIGVWDTVGALGAPGFLGQVLHPKKYAYHDIGLNPMIRNAYHALALDERRKPFAPSLFEPLAGHTGTLEQAWFAGVHCNVGGSYDPDGLANEPLHYMAERAERHGLELDRVFLAHYLPCFNGELRDSMSWTYKAIGPHVRPVGDGECVHQSALDRLGHAESAYDPPNLKARLGRGKPVVVTTTRVARGQPCPPLP